MWTREYFSPGRNNGRNPESPEFSEPPFSGGKFRLNKTWRCNTWLNIGMFEQKTHFVKHQGNVFFLEFNKLPNRTHGQSLDVGIFFVGRMFVFPSTARVTLLGGSQSIKNPLKQIQKFLSTAKQMPGYWSNLFLHPSGGPGLKHRFGKKLRFESVLLGQTNV